MKTLLLTLDFPPTNGGVANYYGNMVSNWPINESLIVINNNQGELAKSDGFWPWRLAFGVLWRKLQRSRIDYILVGQILPLGTVTYLISWFKPIRYGVFLHGMDLTYTLRSPRKKWLSNLILQRADRIICANSYVAQKTEESYAGLSEKIAIVNPGVTIDIPKIEAAEIAALRAQYRLEGQTVLFTLARLVRRKGLDMVIKSLETMPELELANLVYVIGGTGADADFLRKMVPEHLIDKVIFLGVLSERQKWAWLALSDIFIMPARDINGDFEGFGIVYLEANLSNSPVIAGQAGGVTDAVIDGYNGLLVDPLSIEDIQAAIIKLAHDPALRKQLGDQGKQLAITKFNWEQQAAKIANLIK
jgi:phosphatidylinositol alpha-1,6-mannosyltransferase